LGPLSAQANRDDGAFFTSRATVVTGTDEHFPVMMNRL
jgi:hypothetical protein